MEKPVRVKKKKKLGSYPYASVVSSLTIALFVIGLFGLLIIHTQKLKSFIQGSVELQVYLTRNVTESEKAFIEKALASKEYILVKEEVPQVKFISKEEAAHQFIKETGENFVEFLGENPLRDAFVINIDPEYQKSVQMAEIKEDLEQMGGVFEVEYLESFVESINENMTKIGLVLIGFAAILIVVVILLINNTIKLSLFSQRFLIRSMQLVGATKNFIQKPFLYRASLHGLISAIIASALLYAVLRYAYARIDGLSALEDIQMLLILAGALVVLGIILGLLSSYRAINKYLKLSLDELY